MSQAAIAEEETPVLADGDMVSDRYRIDRKLGEGGMGAVYLAEHVLMHKRVALKVLHAELAKSEEVVLRFEREAVAASSIDHPNVAAATDFGRLPDGSFFLVLEYVEGRSLRDEVEKGPMDPERALHIFRGMALAVAAAHAKGIVHRDLKPENVMLVEKDGDPDFVKVLDFGIAKMISQETTAKPEGEGKALTRVGTIVGTPLYMSPEQGLGQQVDGRSDLYTLGVIWYEMLAGAPPFDGDMVSIIRQHVIEPPPPLAQAAIHEPLIRLLLAKQADQRVQTATELVVKLIDSPPGPSVVPAVEPVAAAKEEPAPPKKSKLARRLLLIFAPLAIVVAGVCVWLFFQETERRRRAPVQRDVGTERLVFEEGRRKDQASPPPASSTTQKGSPPPQQKQQQGKRGWGGFVIPW